MRQEKTKKITLTAMMAALVFVATYMIRIPNPATGGYSHMGDCMIFLAVMLLGRKYGAIAGGIGGALSDLLAGAAAWIAPTFLIKFIMAVIMGTLSENGEGSGKKLLFGAAAGGLFQIAAYTLVKVFYFGSTVAIASVPNLTIQTLVGIVLFAVLYKVVDRLAGGYVRSAAKETK